jgi:hypothetical protein
VARCGVLCCAVLSCGVLIDLCFDGFVIWVEAGSHCAAAGVEGPCEWRAVACCAVLCCAVLCCAVLCCAVLCCAVLCCAVLC